MSGIRLHELFRVSHILDSSRENPWIYLVDAANLKYTGWAGAWDLLSECVFYYMPHD